MLRSSSFPEAAPVPVVCAVLQRSNLVLVAQRPAHKHLGLKWEFPGGKVEAGERPETALVREIAEELGCVVQPFRALPRFIHRYDAVTIEMIPFVCALSPDSAEPHPHEHVALRWVSPADLRILDLAAADWPVVDSYFAQL